MIKKRDDRLTHRDVAQPGSAPAWGAGGPRFKSGHPDQTPEHSYRPGERSPGLFVSMSTPLILVTNDDGVHAPGIQALVAALRPLGEVHVVAPDREVSACSQSLTLKHPLRADRIETERPLGGRHARRLRQPRDREAPARAGPTWCVSGINRGANLGEDVFYSGTVGGAREGTFFGVPVHRVLARRPIRDGLPPAAPFAHALLPTVLEKGLPERTLLNVNVPPGPLTRRRDHRPGPARARGHDPGGPRPAAADLLLDRGGPRPVGDATTCRTSSPCARGSSP